MWKTFQIHAVPYSEKSGILYVYGRTPAGKEELILQLFRDSDGDVKIFTRKELNPDFPEQVQRFAMGNTSGTLNHFTERLRCMLAAWSESGCNVGRKNGGTGPGTEKREEKSTGSPVFTDSEYRILLAALAREEQICRRVDEEAAFTDGKESLTDILRSIKRKVHMLQHPQEGGRV